MELLTVSTKSLVSGRHLSRPVVIDDSGLRDIYELSLTKQIAQYSHLPFRSISESGIGIVLGPCLYCCVERIDKTRRDINVPRIKVAAMFH